MTSRPAGIAAISNNQLLRYALLVAGGVAATHLYMALLVDSRVDIWSMLLLSVVALYMVWFQWSQRRALRQRAYTPYLVHVLTYLLVNGSYWLHAALLVATGNGDRVDTAWQGALFGMSLIWGVGLLLHTLGTLVSKGYEDVNV
jgi:hypothetical protein